VRTGVQPVLERACCPRARVFAPTALQPGSAGSDRVDDLGRAELALHQTLCYVAAECQSVQRTLVLDHRMWRAGDNASPQTAQFAGTVVCNRVGELDGLLLGTAPYRLCFHALDTRPAT
jgi:hypothetical protein